MNPNASRLPGHEPADPHAFSARKHCLVLTLIGVSAIGISVLLPGEPRVPADRAKSASYASEASTSAAAKNSSREQVAGHSSRATDKPFDYFPAQFPAPSGEAAEQPPTF